MYASAQRAIDGKGISIYECDINVLVPVDPMFGTDQIKARLDREVGHARDIAHQEKYQQELSCTDVFLDR